MGKKEKKIQNVNKKVMIATIDIGKEKNFGFYRCSDGNQIKPFGFSNDKTGFDKFWNKVYIASITHKVETILIGFESSGSYGIPLIHYLISKQEKLPEGRVKLVQVNPMHTKRVKELSDNSPNKTDKKDPRVIADIIQLGHYLSVIVPKGAAAELRELTHARESEIKDRTVLVNRLEKLIHKIFPEFLTVMKRINTKTAFYIVKNYPTPDYIIKLGLEKLTNVLIKVSRYRLGEKRANKLYEAAQNSAGITEGRKSIIMQINFIIEKTNRINENIEKIEKDMREHLKKIPISENLLSIKGIGEITVAGIIGEVGDFESFNIQKEIITLAGLNLYEVSSGKHKGEKHISKRGRHLLRKILFFATLNVVRKGGILHEYYQGLLDRGMKKIKALIAVSRKLLRIMFALARDKTNYIHNYSKLNLAA